MSTSTSNIVQKMGASGSYDLGRQGQLKISSYIDSINNDNNNKKTAKKSASALDVKKNSTIKISHFLHDWNQ
jgi:hypothetical protein